MTYLDIFRRYRLYLKSLVWVLREAASRGGSGREEHVKFKHLPPFFSAKYFNLNYFWNVSTSSSFTVASPFDKRNVFRLLEDVSTLQSLHIKVKYV